MRMRKKPNLRPRMERCTDWWVREPVSMPGRWRDLAPQCKSLWVEVGCGKGRFTVETAAANPEMLLIAMERVPDAMVMAMERCVAQGLTNVYFIDANADHLAMVESMEQFGANHTGNFRPETGEYLVFMHNQDFACLLDRFENSLFVQRYQGAEVDNFDIPIMFPL